jgi:hypothetical protein
LNIVKYFEGGVSIDFLCSAPKYFIDICGEVIQDENRRIDKENRKRAAQDVINKMRGKRG